MFKLISIFLLFIILPLFNAIQIYSQTLSCQLLHINKIDISGNEKTKSWVIIRECDLRIGDTFSIEQLGDKLEEIKFKLKRLINFSNVNVNYKIFYDSECYVTINIIVIENWLLFPSIIVELADRNLNVWWIEQNHSFKRLNFSSPI